MPDFDAIAIAIAARYDASQMTAPVGYTAIRSATANPPNAMPALPAVIVFQDNGSFDSGNGTRFGTAEYLVRFYFNQIGDLARDEVALRKWLTVLADQHRTSVQLGGLVVTIKTNSWRPGMLHYAGVDYSGIEFGVSVQTSEGWTVSA